MTGLLDPASVFGVQESLLRLGAAALLGGLLGLDREYRGKALGLRTNMLVAVGSASFGMLVFELAEIFRDPDANAMLDPTRVIEGIIGGIGFLGTGAIIQSRGDIHGATTGAAIWVVGGIGLACGFGLYLHAGIVTGIAFLVLVVLGVIERAVKRGQPGG
jgi:putative Mg2+ transporter-C (MgtC) family protein